MTGQRSARGRNRLDATSAAELHMLRLAWSSARGPARRAFFSDLSRAICDQPAAPEPALAIVRSFCAACVRERRGGRVQAREMYRAFLAWCDASAEIPIKETRFGRELKKLFERDDSGSLRAYLGVELCDLPKNKSPAANKSGELLNKAAQKSRFARRRP